MTQEELDIFKTYAGKYEAANKTIENIINVCKDDKIVKSLCDVDVLRQIFDMQEVDFAAAEGIVGGMIFGCGATVIKELGFNSKQNWEALPLVTKTILRNPSRFTAQVTSNLEENQDTKKNLSTLNFLNVLLLNPSPFSSFLQTSSKIKSSIKRLVERGATGAIRGKAMISCGLIEDAAGLERRVMPYITKCLEKSTEDTYFFNCAKAMVTSIVDNVKILARR